MKSFSFFLLGACYAYAREYHSSMLELLTSSIKYKKTVRETSCILFPIIANEKLAPEAIWFYSTEKLTFISTFSTLMMHRVN